MIFTYGDVLDTNVHLIAHQVNCKGVMGSGLAKQIRDRYPSVYNIYREYIKAYYEDYGKIPLGSYQVAYAEDTENGERNIVNIFGQNEYGLDKCYTDYDAVRRAFKSLDKEFIGTDRYEGDQIPIAIPYGFGCGLGGGNWEKMKEVLKEIEKETHILFIVYKLETNLTF